MTTKGITDAVDVGDNDDNEDPPVLLFIDTAGCGMHESLHESSLSRYNTGEAQLVVQHVQYLLEKKLQYLMVNIVIVKWLVVMVLYPNQQIHMTMN